MNKKGFALTLVLLITTGISLGLVGYSYLFKNRFLHNKTVVNNNELTTVTKITSIHSLNTTTTVSSTPLPSLIPSYPHTVTKIKNLNTTTTTTTIHPVTTTVSSTASTVSPVQITSLTIKRGLYSVTINWDTNQETISRVYLSGPEMDEQPFSSEMGLGYHHRVNIFHLIPSSTYNYKIIARDPVKEDIKTIKSGSFQSLPQVRFDDIVIKKDSFKYESPDKGYYMLQFISRSTDNPIPTLKILYNNQLYITDDNGFIKLLGPLPCNTQLDFKIYPNPLDSSWYEKTMYICFPKPVCEAGWKCQDSNHRAYQHKDCSWSDKSECEFGCNEGMCNQCMPGQKCKDSSTKGYQNSDCSWRDIQNCSCGCSAGKCLDCRTTTTCGGICP